MKRFALLVSSILVAVLVVPSYAARPTPEPGAPVCAIQGINRADGVVNTVVRGTKYNLVSLSGPGKFVAARLVLWGAGVPYQVDQTTVEVVIDGRTVVQDTVADLSSQDFYHFNPFGIDLGAQKGAEGPDAVGRTVRIGFPLPVAFDTSLVLSATAEGTTSKITATVIYGE
jgi:hypothetical protein